MIVGNATEVEALKSALAEAKEEARVSKAAAEKAAADVMTPAASPPQSPGSGRHRGKEANPELTGGLRRHLTASPQQFPGSGRAERHAQAARKAGDPAASRHYRHTHRRLKKPGRARACPRGAAQLRCRRYVRSKIQPPCSSVVAPCRRSRGTGGDGVVLVAAGPIPTPGRL